MTDAQYVVVGELAEPTDAQHKRAARNGGWEARTINGLSVLWNACVSPPWAGGPYNFNEGDSHD